jgi:hypothetical protein
MSTRSVGRSAAIAANSRSAATSANGRRAAAHEVDRSTATRDKDRLSRCSFTFADGRQCRSPRRDGHPHFYAFHARKEDQALAGDQAGQDIAYHLSGSYISAGDLSSALGRLFAAVAQGQGKPKTAATLTYLGQLIVQATRHSQHESTAPIP